MKKFLLSVLIIFLPTFCFSSYDAGYNYTSGPNAYKANDFSFNADVSKTLSLNFQYSAYSSSISSVTRTLYSGLNFNLGKNFNAGISLSITPESEDYKTNSTGLNAGWGFSFDNKPLEESSWWLQLGANRQNTNNSQRIYQIRTKRYVWINLEQSSFETNASLRLFELTTLSLASTKYSYDKDLNTVQKGLYLLSSINPTLSNTLFMVQGFPGNSLTIGFEQNFWDYFNVSLNKTRIVYLLYKDYSDSILAEISTCYFQPFKFKIGFNTDQSNTKDKSTYISFGINYYF
ncbi:MAG: hypothetical protein KKH91_05440 [Elusimicrobia bacterium]|nr:hypothetical protein [Elusimicrobiota bacterium]MBU2614465.1 hypothetical protein [Elusimicrobiota bacterium]